MPKLRPAPKREEELEAEPTVYGAEDQKPLFESKDEIEDEAEDKKQEEPVEKKKPEEDASLALKKQIEELRKSERLAQAEVARARQEREEAMRRANEREMETLRIRDEASDARMVGIDAGIAAAKAEAETAERDMENAASIGDVKAQAEAARRLVRAETNLSKLEDGKAALAEERERQKNIRPVSHENNRPLTVRERLDKTDLPENAKVWLENHEEYLDNRRKNAQIQSLHWEIVEDEGLKPYSPEYFESMEIRLGMRKAEKTEDEPEEDNSDNGKGSVVSAPVSRESNGSRPTNPSQVRLTKDQVAAAKMAGITPAEYAKQLLKLQEHKDNGMYSEGR